MPFQVAVCGPRDCTDAEAAQPGDSGNSSPNAVRS
jgi:hypothetical protein